MNEILENPKYKALLEFLEKNLCVENWMKNSIVSVLTKFIEEFSK